ncbi:MAG: FecR domain-containing protein [Chitinophagaceae bacterium]
MPENPEYTWFLLSRHLSGEATAAEEAALQQWLAEDPNHQQQYELLSQLWQAKKNPPPPPTDPSKISRIFQLAAVEEALHESPDTTPEETIIHKKSYAWKVAATLIVLAFCTWGTLHWFTFGSITDNNHQVVAQKGSRTRAILPDGSTVWLNAGSSISYGKTFNDKIREVTLYGEAYFDVVKQPDRPFIVHAGDINIKVLGTSFNVKSYPGDDLVETTLIKGLVQIIQPGNKPAIYLHPNQKISLPSASHEISTDLPDDLPANSSGQKKALSEGIATIDTTLSEKERIETAWLFNRLEFRDDDFEALAKKLERWYNVTIHFEDEKARLLVFNGSIESESVEQAFKALQVAVPFKYSIKGNEIFIGSGR